MLKGCLFGTVGGEEEYRIITFCNSISSGVVSIVLGNLNMSSTATLTLTNCVLLVNYKWVKSTHMGGSWSNN